MRLLWGAALLDLGLALCLLVAHKLGWLGLSRHGFLLAVNVNMLLCAVAAAATVGLSLRQRGGWAGQRGFGWLLLLVTLCCVAAETASFAAEFVVGLASHDLLTALPALLGRAAMVALALSVALRGRVPGAAPSAPSMAAALIAGASLAALAIPLVLVPLWFRPGPAADAALATADLAALLPLLWIMPRLQRQRSAARLWAVVGLALLLVTELYLYRHSVTGEGGFVVSEVGFYAGYWVVALAGGLGLALARGTAVGAYLRSA